MVQQSQVFSTSQYGLIISSSSQAARVTAACGSLKNTGPVIRSRPLQYINTPQLELDSYLSFSNAITLRVSVGEEWREGEGEGVERGEGVGRGGEGR